MFELTEPTLKVLAESKTGAISYLTAAVKMEIQAAYQALGHQPLQTNCGSCIFRMCKTINDYLNEKERKNQSSIHDQH